jgi:hypothetical protein
MRGSINSRVVIEHIGLYALSRLTHEMADVVHGMIVTVSISPKDAKLMLIRIILQSARTEKQPSGAKL